MDIDVTTLAPLILSLVAAGAVAGLIAGMFGVGGGVVIVPAMFFVLNSLGYSETAMHVAVGTSLATIIATSIRSVMAHNKHASVDWEILKTWTPWIILGAVAGSFVANAISGRELTIVFCVCILVVSLQFLLGRPSWRLADEPPTGVLRGAIGSSIGVLSALMGIGGGVFGVTLLTLFGRPIHLAVGTAAGFGVAIGLPAAIGFAWNGRNALELPPLSLGFLSLPGFLIIALLTTTLAPVGARLAHKLDAVMLRRVFGAFIILIAGNMLRRVLLG